MLAVIRQAMDNFMVDQTSEQILRCLGAFTDQWEKLAEAIDKVGRQIESTQKAFGELNGPRRRAVERTFAQVDELRTSTAAAPGGRRGRRPSPAGSRTAGRADRRETPGRGVVARR